MNLIIHPDQRADWKGRLMRCAIGRAGLTSDKREGDGATPVGKFPMREIFYRSDRLGQPATGLPCRSLTADDGWCDDPEDPNYNQLIALPYKASHETLMREDGLYDLVVVLGYNDNPVIAGKGSAIFLHVAKPDFSPTEGCVALEFNDLWNVITEAEPGDLIEILPAYTW